MVSILMGTNCCAEKLDALKLAVSSILKQSYSDFEFLICETDASDAAKKYLELIEDSRVRVITNKESKTLAQKLNCCLFQARGSVIVRMDDDDISDSTRIEKQITFLQTHTSIDFLGCNVVFDDKCGYTSVRTFPPFPSPKDFLHIMPFIHPTLCFRKEVLLAVGGYRESIWCDGCEDYDLLLRLYEHGFQGANLQEVLFNYSVQNNLYKNKRYFIRINEAVTRFQRFYALGMFPQAIPYVFRPLIVGLIPSSILRQIKRRRWRK